MKQTSDDLRFAGDFSAALASVVFSERKKGRSLKRIAGELGITEPALKKCLRGRTTPCLRTVVLAFRKFRVAVPYSGVALFRGPAKRSAGPADSLQQLVFPFEIQTPGPDDRLTLKLLPTGVQKYELQLMLRLAG